MEIIYACSILFHALLCKASALHNTRHGVHDLGHTETKLPGPLPRARYVERPLSVLPEQSIIILCAKGGALASKTETCGCEGVRAMTCGIEREGGLR